ncbi:hypothetical protein GQX74_009889 [Glossina fuscipes]|nr:hypothetical protein GQX74_009889 [Glossina fuscipes]
MIDSLAVVKLRFSFLSAIGFMGMCSEEESTTVVATRSLLFAEAFSMLRGDDDRMIMFSAIWTICLSSMQSGCKSDIVVVVSIGIAVGVFLLAVNSASASDNCRFHRKDAKCCGCKLDYSGRNYNLCSILRKWMFVGTISWPHLK